MPKRCEFVDFLLGKLAPLGDVSAKSMFGGWGIYSDGHKRDERSTGTGIEGDVQRGAVSEDLAGFLL
jgi:hypothetical protein